MSVIALEPTHLDKLRDKRNALTEDWAKLISDRVEARGPFNERVKTDEYSKLSQEERDKEIDAFRDAEAAFVAESDRREAEIKDLDEEIRRHEDIARRRNDAARAAAGSPQVTIEREALLYRSDNTRGEDGLSYYRDLALVHGPGITLRTGGTRDHAQKRLIQHAEQMDVEMPKRAKLAEARARAQFEKAETEFLMGHRDRRVDKVLQEIRGGISYNPFESRVTPNTADGQGGYFVPPLWLVDEFIPGLRAHLVLAALCRQMDLPAGTNSINIPKLANLTTVGYQQLNNSGLPSADWTDTFVQANVKTIGGYSDVALQLLEQSPLNIVDEVITRDLMAARDKFLDGEVIAGDGVGTATLNGGHLMGIYPYTNWGANNVTYTDGSPAPAHMAPGVFGPMASKIARTRFDAQNFKVVMHGRRWFYYSTGLDVNGRPLGETAAGGRFNVQAAQESGLQAEGLVGSLPYLADAPVYIDDNIPTADTTGGGTGQDVAIAGLFDDAWLFNSPLRTDVFREVLSSNLGVRFRAYNYGAFLIRYGQSFAVATGSGFAAPSTGYGDFF